MLSLGSLVRNKKKKRKKADHHHSSRDDDDDDDDSLTGKRDKVSESVATSSPLEGQSEQ